MNDTSVLLNELLAVIHRDGGHHTDEAGVEQSTADATSTVVRLQADNDEYQRTFELIQRAECRAIAKWRARDPEKRELFLPDGTALIVWLLKQLDERDRELKRLRQPIQAARA